jgi:hypothetical protein
MERATIDPFARPRNRPSGAVRPASIAGPVVRGDQRGRELGFPTANLVAGPGAVRDGVWAGIVMLGDGSAHVATVSVGRRVTFYGRDGIRLVEAHLLDFSGDLYGQRAEVRLHAKLRRQRRFPDADALIAQMRQDVADTRTWAAAGLCRDGERAAAGLSPWACPAGDQEAGRSSEPVSASSSRSATVG